MGDLSLDQLRSFTDVVELGSFSAAAERRGREAAQFHHVGEAAELVEAEIAHPKVFLMLCMRGQSFPHGAGGWKSPAMFLRTTAA